MKKTISLSLALLIFTINIIFTVSCKGGNEENPPKTCFSHNDGNQNGYCDSCGEKIQDSTPQKDAEIKVPEYKDYLRGTKNFDELVYSRPDISGAIALLNSLSEMISENALPYEEQLKKLDEASAVYKNVKTMNSLATIYNYKDSSNEFWLAEYHYITTNYPSFSQGVEALFVSAANSPHAESFEKDFFGEGLEEYKYGGIYTDTVVELMKREAELETEYSSISSSNVTISYEGITDSYDAVLSFYKEKYSEGSTEYLKAKMLCDSLYQAEVSKLEANLLVELIRARKQISDALGYESYEQFAYDTLYHDYEPRKMQDFIDAVTEYVIPVYLNLSRELFSPYVYDYEKTVNGYKTEKAEIINTLYDVYTESDTKLGEIYSYMLQHSLYDVEESSQNRFKGSFTTYIDTNASPFLFVTLDNSILDYLTLAHEFGHFADGYINNDANASLDTLEISSQALELLTLTKLDEILDEKDYHYILYLKLDEIISTVIFQSFYASFEISAYELDYDDITLENLNQLVSKTAKSFGLSSNCNSVEFVAIPHIFLYPFYVQSYATSAAAAIEIYTLEAKAEGEGFKTYNALLARDGEARLSFEETLKFNGLSSPFEKRDFKNILNELHYAALGAYFYKSHDGNVA